MAEHHSEEQLAQKRNLRQQSVYRRRRKTSISAVTAGTLAALICWWQTFEFGFICTLAVVLIALLFWLDANGHLDELGRRSKKALSPSFSLLDKEEKEGVPIRQPSAQRDII